MGKFTCQIGVFLFENLAKYMGNNYECTSVRRCGKRRH